MRGVRAIAAAALLACAPRATVRPGAAGTATEFEYRERAEEVWLTGDMTGWKRVPLARDDGAFRLSLDLAPGRYEYRLEVRDDGGIHPVYPKGAERVDDGFGGENAIVRVGER